MIDTMTNKPLKLLTGEGTISLLSVPRTQLPEVRKLFDEKGVFYWVDEYSISIDGGPLRSHIEISKRGCSTSCACG